MNNNITFEEYIENLTRYGFIFSIGYRTMDNRLWIEVRKNGASFIDYIDNPGDYLTFKIVLRHTIENIVNKVEKLLGKEGERT